METHKRSRQQETTSRKVAKTHNDSSITTDFLEECNKNFNSNPLNVITKNSVTSAGVFFTSMNNDRINELNFLFPNSLKKKNVKTTNQGASGRCWIFAGLNMLRHPIINVCNLTDFEFSETYLFFYDKLEKANTYLHWFIENGNTDMNSQEYNYMLNTYMTDGGYFDAFFYLVKKYGLVPKTAMKETAHSGDSEDMNRIINSQLTSTANYIRKNYEKFSLEELQKIRVNTLKVVYNTLVKFLGTPPKKFDLLLETDEESEIFSKTTPASLFDFSNVITNFSEGFVTLTHLPAEKFVFYSPYVIKNTKTIYEEKDMMAINVPMDELVKYAMKCIDNKVPVWFACDVTKSFYGCYLDDVLDSTNLMFEQPYEFEKGDRLTMRNVQANHAMTIIGYNLNERSQPVTWQVENSWGYFDSTVAGEDGTLTMSHSWFKKYVIEIVVPVKLLSRNIEKVLTQEPIVLEPWTNVAPALRSL